MNDTQFVFWMKGYIDAGGSDINFIKEKMNSIIPYAYPPYYFNYPITCTGTSTGTYVTTTSLVKTILND